MSKLGIKRKRGGTRRYCRETAGGKQGMLLHWPALSPAKGVAEMLKEPLKIKG